MWPGRRIRVHGIVLWITSASSPWIRCDEARVAEQREQLLVVGHAAAERIDHADAPVAGGGDEVGLVELLQQRAAVDEVHGLAAGAQLRAVVGELVERRPRRLQPGRAGGGADDPELRHGGRALGVGEHDPRALGQVLVAPADVRVGLQQRAHQLGQHRRVGGVELLPHARKVDRRGQALVEDVRVADAGRRVGVELEELDVVADEEGVETADAHRARVAGLDPDQRVLLGRHRQLVAQRGVVRIGVAEAVQHLRQSPDRMAHVPQLPGGDEVRHEHERDRRLVEDDVVLGQPRLDALLEPRTRVAELGQLDEVLELEVVDVVDQGPNEGTGAPDARGGTRTRTPRGAMDFESIMSASSITRAGPYIVGGGDCRVRGLRPSRGSRRARRGRAARRRGARGLRRRRRARARPRRSTPAGSRASRTRSAAAAAG